MSKKYMLELSEDEIKCLQAGLYAGSKWIDELYKQFLVLAVSADNKRLREMYISAASTLKKMKSGIDLIAEKANKAKEKKPPCKR